MRIQRSINRPIRVKRPGLDLVGDINAAVAANIGERGTTTSVHSVSHVTTVQSTARPADNEGTNAQEETA